MGGEVVGERLVVAICCRKNLFFWRSIWTMDLVSPRRGREGRRPEAGGLRPETGGWRLEAGGRTQAGGWRPEAGGRRPEAGSQRPEAGGPEAGGRRPEAGDRRPEAHPERDTTSNDNTRHRHRYTTPETN